MGTMRGKGVEVVGMVERRRLEVLCIQETKWRGNRARMMLGGRKLLHAGGDGRSSGVGIVISEEIGKEVVIVERWKERISMGYDEKTGVYVCYVCVWATDGKDGGRETGVQGCIVDDDMNGRVGHTAMYCRIL